MNPERRPSQDPNERALDVLTQRIRAQIARLIREATPDAALEDQAQEVITRLAERCQSIFSNQQEKCEGFVAGLRELKFQTREELNDELARRFAVFALQLYSPVEFETLLRTNAAERNSFTQVNEALSYEVIKDDERENDQISLHIPMMYTKKPTEMLSLFQQGLRVLADRLDSDPTLADIPEITGYTWIAYEHPELVKKMGFTIKESSPEKHKGYVSMSREDFIKRYGSHKTI
jgi:hypothetical protein